jgi:hypothetical protein
VVIVDVDSIRVTPGTYYFVGFGDAYLGMPLPARPTQLEMQIWPELPASGKYVVPNRADRRRKKSC